MLPFQESLKSANFTTSILQISPTTTDTTVLAGYSTVHLAAIIGGGIAVVVILVILVTVAIVRRRRSRTKSSSDGEYGRTNIVA